MVFAVWRSTCVLPRDVAEALVVFLSQLVQGCFCLSSSTHDHKLIGEGYFRNVDNSCLMCIHEIDGLRVNTQSIVPSVSKWIFANWYLSCVHKKQINVIHCKKYQKCLFLIYKCSVAAVFFTNGFLGMYDDGDWFSLILILYPISLASTSLSSKSNNSPRDQMSLLVILATWIRISDGNFPMITGTSIAFVSLVTPKFIDPRMWMLNLSKRYYSWLGFLQCTDSVSLFHSYAQC